MHCPIGVKMTALGADHTFHALSLAPSLALTLRVLDQRGIELLQTLTNVTQNAADCADEHSCDTLKTCRLHNMQSLLSFLLFFAERLIFSI